MGYIVMSARKSKEAQEFFAPLSYGRGQEPAHEQLLRRGRGTMFATERDALAALEATLKKATADGDEWPKKFQYAIIEVEHAPGSLFAKTRESAARLGETVAEFEDKFGDKHSA